MNNYSVPSIANELRWALDPNFSYNFDHNIVQIAPNRFAEFHMSGLKPSRRSEVVRCRQAITEVTRRISECRVVILTLGLSECWYDFKSDLYLNTSPPRSLVAKDPDRFELHVLDFTETINWLRLSISTLRRYCRSDQVILLTVSPVPLTATYTDQDVLVANSYSKAVLRAAADHIISENSNIDYFPSYESVILSERHVAWEQDQIHVTPAMISHNVSRMIDVYTEADEKLNVSSVYKMLDEAKDFINVGINSDAGAILSRVRSSVIGNADLGVEYAELCIKLGRLSDAREIFLNMPDKVGGWRREYIESKVASCEGDPKRAEKILLDVIERNPRRAVLLRGLTELYIQQSEWDRALPIAKRWVEAVAGRKAEPLRKLAFIHSKKGDFSQADFVYKEAIADGSLPAAILDYCEFLIQHGRVSEASEVFNDIHADTPALRRRKAQLSLFVSSDLNITKRKMASEYEFDRAKTEQG